MRSLLSPLFTALRMPPLALRNVMQGRVRSLVAISGIGFSVVMVLLQLGFLEAVKITASTNYDQLDFDVMLISPGFEQFYDPGEFPLERLRQARGIATVKAAIPLYARMNMWRCPSYPVTASTDSTVPDQNAIVRAWLGEKRPRPLQRRELLVLGIDLDRNPFRSPIRDQIQAAESLLRVDGRVLLNSWSNPDFGWGLRDEFHGWELGRRRVDVVGGFTLRRSFGADATVLCSDATFASAFERPLAATPVNFGLLTVQPGTIEATVAELNQRLPHDVQALSRSELDRVEKHYWVTQTATGKIFAFGVFVTMIVAAVVVYQVLSQDIRNRLPEYATLKAMGHSNHYLGRVVLLQAMIYAIAAYLPAAALSAGLYRVTEAVANIPMTLTRANLIWVLALTILASLGSGILTVRKLGSANPADLF